MAHILKADVVDGEDDVLGFEPPLLRRHGIRRHGFDDDGKVSLGASLAADNAESEPGRAFVQMNRSHATHREEQGRTPSHTSTQQLLPSFKQHL